MGNKFTPGPWLMETSFNTIWIWDEGKNSIVTHINLDKEYKSDVVENKNANAKLISAAPDLLKALKEMVRMYESVQPAGGWQGVYDESVYTIKKALD